MKPSHQLLNRQRGRRYLAIAQYALFVGLFVGLLTCISDMLWVAPDRQMTFRLVGYKLLFSGGGFVAVFLLLGLFGYTPEAIRKDKDDT